MPVVARDDPPPEQFGVLMHLGGKQAAWQAALAPVTEADEGDGGDGGEHEEDVDGGEQLVCASCDEEDDGGSDDGSDGGSDGGTQPAAAKRARCAAKKSKKKRGGWAWAEAAAVDTFGEVPALEQPDAEELAEYREMARRGNVTAFTRGEATHPVNFFEQAVRCKHCGCDRLRPTRARLCCDDGDLVLDGPPMGDELIELLSEGAGVSQTSRTLNDLFRFAQQGLPKGTHRLNLAGGHLKVTGVPFSIIDGINANTSTRSFLDDPAERELRANRVDSAYRPTERSIAIVRMVLEDAPLARSLVNWAAAEVPSARLELKWPGSTASVRAFTVDPAPPSGRPT